MSQARHKEFALRIKAAGDASAEQLARIRAFTLADIPAEQLYVRTFALAHNAIDRDDEAFDDALLADFARTLPGKGLFIKHPTDWQGDSGPGEGLWFETELQHMGLDEARKLLGQPGLQWPPGITTATVLMAGAYMARTDENKGLLLKIDAGIATFVSIGFTAKRGGYFLDEQGREMQARRLTSPGEALEGSLVWLGAQPGARAIKGANRNNSEEDTDMPTQQELDAANSKAADFENKLKAAQPSHDIVLKARTALGDDAHLIEKPADLAETVKAGQAFRDSLVDDIVAAERHAGMCGDSEEEIAAAKAIYAGTALPILQARAKAAREKTPAPKVAPADPNASKDAPASDKSTPAVIAKATIL